MVLQFCPVCRNLLQLKEEHGKIIGFCSCGFKRMSGVEISLSEKNKVKINEKGRIGAEKIFNFIKRFDKGNLFEAIKKAVEIIKKRTKYIRAINIIISNSENDYVVSIFNEDPEYFTMHCKKNKYVIVCSEPFPNEDGWEKIGNNTIKVLE